MSGLLKLWKKCALAYRLLLPPDMSRIHNVFNISQLRRYIPNPSHILEVRPLLIQGNLNEELTYEEVPIQIVDTKYQVLRGRYIPCIKIKWSNHTEREVTWELKEKMLKQYYYIFEEQVKKKSYELDGRYVKTQTKTNLKLKETYGL